MNALLEGLLGLSKTECFGICVSVICMTVLYIWNAFKHKLFKHKESSHQRTRSEFMIILPSCPQCFSVRTSRPGLGFYIPILKPRYLSIVCPLDVTVKVRSIYHSTCRVQRRSWKSMQFYKQVSPLLFWTPDKSPTSRNLSLPPCVLFLTKDPSLGPKNRHTWYSHQTLSPIDGTRTEGPINVRSYQEKLWSNLCRPTLLLFRVGCIHNLTHTKLMDTLSYRHMSLSLT